MSSNRPSDEFRKPDDISELTELEDLNKEELKEKAIGEFNISEDEWDDKVNSEPMFSEKMVDNIASINKYFAERIENILAGKRLQRTGKGEEKWIQHEKAMAGSLLIKSCVGIIGTFANPSMLISGTREQDYNMQFEDAFKKISDLIVMPHTYVDVNSIRVILKEFKDTFWNMGSILSKTGKNMESYFNALNKEYTEVDGRIKSKIGDY